MPGWISALSQYLFNTKEEKILDVCLMDYLGKGFHDYLLNRQFITEGYTKVSINNVDFTSKRSFMRNGQKIGMGDIFGELHQLLSDDIVLMDAIITPDQFKTLVWREFDLSHHRFQVNQVLSIETYTDIYLQCKIAEVRQKTLKYLSVNLDGCDARRFDDDFVTGAHVVSLHKARLSQSQFDKLLQMRSSQHFGGLIFSGLNLTNFLLKYHRNITFIEAIFKKKDQPIFVGGSSIEGAIIDMSVLTQLCPSTFSPWFTCGTFTITWHDNERKLLARVNPHQLLFALELKSKRRVFAFFDRDQAQLKSMRELLKAQYEATEAPLETDFDVASMGELFLYLCRFVVTHRDHAMAKAMLDNFYVEHAPALHPA